VVARDVAEDDDPAVGLGAGLAEELDPGCLHALVAAVEVVDAEEEPDPGGVLVAIAATWCSPSARARRMPVCPPGGRTTTQRLGRPSFVRAGESSASSNPSARVKKAIASS
jgi:hypothetical protein